MATKQIGMYEITEAMQVYGGSFVKLLGQAFRAADEVNTRRLEAAFPEYIEEYREMAAMRARRASEAE
jgi:hypothetical protein